MSENYPFDRPVIILAAPRSGSTLLFESMLKSTDLWTIGGESHAMFESIPRFNPAMGYCDSNALSAADATPDIVRQIRLRFFQALRDAEGRGFNQFTAGAGNRPRLLEKTPKNALRVSLLNELFPDALYIYLYRNPRENISSMIDAWESGRFVTYPSLPGRNSGWSLLLPPGWQAHHASPVEEMAAFQWEAANRAILEELNKLDKSRWTAVSYGQQVGDTVNTIERLCAFCDVSPDAILRSMSGGYTQFSTHTVTAPEKGKWHKNAAALSRVLPALEETIEFIRANTDGLPAEEFDLTIEAALLQGAQGQ